MTTGLYIAGYASLFASVISAFVAAKKNKYIPLIISAVLLAIAWIILWSLE